MHVPESVKRYVRFRWLTGLLVLLAGSYLARIFVFAGATVEDLTPGALHISIVWATLGVVGLTWVIIDLLSYRYYWRRRLAVGYLHQMAIHTFPRPRDSEGLTSYLWNVYQTAPNVGARLVAAEWIGLIGGLTLAASSQTSRSRDALQKALASYRERIDSATFERFHPEPFCIQAENSLRSQSERRTAAS